MSRHDGHPVPFEHQFYRSTLKGLFSLDLSASGTFSYRSKSGFRNLDDVRMQKAQTIPGIEHLESEKCYRLPLDQRLARIRSLFTGMAQLEGGAKLSIHYTDVAPALVMFTVTSGGNHILNHVIGANKQGRPELKLAALQEALSVNADQLLSPVYLGWTQGYLDEERAKLSAELGRDDSILGQTIQMTHPRRAYEQLIASLSDSVRCASWLL